MTAPPGDPDVGELRRRLRARRRALDSATQRDHATAAAERALDLPEITTASSAGVYLADDGELDPRPLIERLVDRSVVVHLPVVEEDDVMRFRSWDTVSPLLEGRWGLAVPADPTETRAATQLDVVIAPLVAVDGDGTRIGRGAGYYDRALARRIGGDGNPTIIGYGHHFQLVDDALPRRSWDVPLDVLVTEQESRRWTDRDQPVPGSDPDRR
jgi:5-formyltetrahydrofolate cyclo-ligase